MEVNICEQQRQRLENRSKQMSGRWRNRCFWRTM